MRLAVVSEAIEGSAEVLHTSSTLPLPLSLTLNAYDSSRPVFCSVRVKKAWCGRLAFLPSVVVRIIFRVSEAPSGISVDRGASALSLTRE